MERFKFHAQPIEDWVQMSQTIVAATPMSQPSSEEPKGAQTQSGTDSTIHRDLGTDRLPGAWKLDGRVQINRCELWSLDEVCS
jgi:hypothetical protein